MNAVRSSIVCQRIREQVSLRLDGELSQLELRMVAAHLERCVECQAFEASVSDFTEELRAAPLESPRLPIVVRRAHRRVALSAAQVGVAATLAIALLGVLSQVGVPGSPDPAVGGRLSTTNLFKTSWSPEREIAQLDTNLPGTNRPGPVPGDLTRRKSESASADLDRVDQDPFMARRTRTSLV